MKIEGQRTLVKLFCVQEHEGTNNVAQGLLGSQDMHINVLFASLTTMSWK